jgi:hypothetical protein
MFSIEEDLRSISMFREARVIQAILQTLHPTQVQQVRRLLNPHWSDTYQPSLDQYFTKHTCKLCELPALNRKQHFHTHCQTVKHYRDKSNSMEEFETAINGVTHE